MKRCAHVYNPLHLNATQRHPQATNTAWVALGEGRNNPTPQQTLSTNRAAIKELAA